MASLHRRQCLHVAREWQRIGDDDWLILFKGRSIRTERKWRLMVDDIRRRDLRFTASVTRKALLWLATPTRRRSTTTYTIGSSSPTDFRSILYDGTARQRRDLTKQHARKGYVEALAATLSLVQAVGRTRRYCADKLCPAWSQSAQLQLPRHVGEVWPRCGKSAFTGLNAEQRSRRSLTGRR
jgi:hypothetical protein